MSSENVFHIFDRRNFRKVLLLLPPLILLPLLLPHSSSLDKLAEQPVQVVDLDSKQSESNWLLYDSETKLFVVASRNGKQLRFIDVDDSYDKGWASSSSSSSSSVPFPPPHFDNDSSLRNKATFRNTYNFAHQVSNVCFGMVEDNSNELPQLYCCLKSGVDLCIIHTYCHMVNTKRWLWLLGCYRARSSKVLVLDAKGCQQPTTTANWLVSEITPKLFFPFG